MKNLICLTIMLCLILPASASQDQSKSRHDTFTTSNDTTRYSVLTARGNTIEAKGFYQGHTVADFELINAEFKNYSLDFKPESDGTYTAVFTGIPDSNFAYIRITLENDLSVKYRVDYDGQWYFPEWLGIADKHISVVENYTEIPLEVVVQYLVGEDYFAGDITSTLNQINEIAKEITDGLDSDYDKARAISAWVADNIYYDYEARDKEVTVETIALKNVLQTRKTVCGGYANLTAALNTVVGLKSVTVLGRTKNINEYDNLIEDNNPHEWTAFWYEEENRWVLLDSGWDSWNYYENGSYVRRETPRRYFDITSLALSQDHVAVKSEYRDWFSAIEYEYYDNPDSNGLLAPKPIDTSIVNNNFERYDDFDHYEHFKSSFRIMGVIAIIVAIGICAVAVIVKMKKNM